MHDYTDLGLDRSLSARIRIRMQGSKKEIPNYYSISLQVN